MRRVRVATCFTLVDACAPASSYPSRRVLVRFSCNALPAALVALAALALPSGSASAQQPARDTTASDSLSVPVVTDSALPLVPLTMRLRADTLFFERPRAFRDLGRFGVAREEVDAMAERRTSALQSSTSLRRSALWGTTLRDAMSPRALPDSGVERQLAQEPPPLQAPSSQNPSPLLVDSSAAAAAARDSLPNVAGAAADLLGQYADLGLQLQARLQSKLERNKNERCTSFDILNPIANCSGSFQPQFDFQFNVRTGGTVADRVHVNVDYDSEREFDASNNINVYYEGKSDEIIHRLEVGNVSFAPPSSRFITGGIPAGNYGLQATGQLGPMNFRTIIAQQKGNVVKDRVFTVGDRTVQTVSREIEDYQVERRRFFWVVDPTVEFASQYPNIDVLDNAQMASLASSLAPNRRPRRVLVYRYRPPSASGSIAADINGPTAVALGARNQNPIGPYQLLQQGVDYYLDPTNLWIAMVSPANRGERLAISYTVTGPGGAETTVTTVGGSFPTTSSSGRIDTLVLLWDNEVLPGDATFTREMRNVYRLGGEDIQRNTVELKLVVGSGEQEQSQTPGAPTYLEVFGLAQRTNTSAFDVENRLWPRTGDPNQAANAGGGSTKLIRDYFVIFPSLQPFADAGLANPPDPVNDSLYRTPDDDLYSQRRPPTQYRLSTRYQADGGGDVGVIPLGSIQVRQGSERIIMGGVPLVRDVDYRVDYELGQLTFLRPDTLFRTAKQVSVRYEENPLFASAPTSIFGIASEFPFQNGQINFVAISQSQKTTFNRPPLGFEPASSLVAGVNGSFGWESGSLTRALDRLPILETTAPSFISVQGEIATSRPQPNAAGQAYVESFEGEGGIPMSLSELAWRVGSQPAVPGGATVIAGVPFDFDTSTASTIAWQNLAAVRDTINNVTNPIQFFPEQIDTTITFTGSQAFRTPEQVLWMTLYPLSIGGAFCNICARSDFKWKIPGLAGRRWRSLSQTLSPSGVDLSRVENLDFWVLIDTSTFGRRANPALVFDFGDISENSVSIVPETLVVRSVVDTLSSGGLRAREDSTFSGRRVEGFGVMNSERDQVTKSFDHVRDDTGLPGDVADSLFVVHLDSGIQAMRYDQPICRHDGLTLQLLGDTKNNCTVGNRQLNEEDLDLDGVLNLAPSQRDSERLLRYVIDLSDAALYNRFGRCLSSVTDSITGAGSFCWVNIRVPFGAPTETVNDPLVRRIKSLRMTMVSSPFAAEDLTQVPVARLKLVGSPWVKRGDRAIGGVGGSREEGNGFMIATVIGTQDRDSRSGGLFYESPPGVTDQADNKQSDFEQGIVQINEKSMRLVAGDIPLFARAEAFYRFPEGEKSFMGYKELRVWARGRNKGWGPGGDMNFYIKIGRDQDNFYLYRTPVNAGPSRDNWLPEVVVDFDRFFALRARVQNNFLQGGQEIDCTGIDSALVVSSEQPTASGSVRYAACDDGYIVYTANPGITPPNLAGVQEMAVGMLRVGDTGLGTGGAIFPNDSLEVWVDDIRLTGVVDDPGYAGQISFNVQAGDIGTVQLTASRHDRNFRQLAEQPSYNTASDIGISTSFRLDKFLPRQLGLLLPMSVSYSSSGNDPFFLARSDVQAAGIEGLRVPKSHSTTYSLSARRATPMQGSLIAPIVNNLNVSASYGSASSTSEYAVGSSSRMSGAVDWNLTSTARTARLPGWFRGALGILPAFIEESDAIRSLKNTEFRWNPTQVRLSSTYAKTQDTRRAFTLPVAVAGDSGRPVNGLTSVMRNVALLQMRPFPALSAGFNITSVRDLRNYDSIPLGGQLNVGEVARGERDQLLGLDLGLERERQMGFTLNFSPTITSWVRPRVDFNTSYSLLRDPNSPRLLQLGDSTGEFRLPRRLTNGQGLGLGTSVDFGRAIMLHSAERTFYRRIAALLQPVDINWRRDMRSSFDGVPFTPGLGYQFALGGVEDFREQNGQLATSAGVTRTLNAGTGLNLPFGTTFQSRYARTHSSAFTRRLDAQSVLESETVTFPDLSLRWSMRPRVLGAIFQSLGAAAEYRATESRSFQPTQGEGEGIADENDVGIRGEQSSTVYRVSPSITWALGSGLTTAGGWSKTDRKELRSGGLTLGETTEITANVGKAFKLPEKYQGRLVRASLGFARSNSESHFEGETDSRRLQDLGRWGINLNADTDVAENMTFSMTAARSSNFDNLYDRRFTQMVITATLHLTFFAGDLR